MSNVKIEFVIGRCKRQGPKCSLIPLLQFNKLISVVGRCVDLEVSVLAFYSKELGSNPAEVDIFFI